MPKKNKFNEFSEAAKVIREKFLAPVIKNVLSEREESNHEIEIFFSPGNRKIKEYKITQGFKVPGKQKSGPDATKRFFGKGWHALVRYDDRDPEYLDVCLFKKWNDSSFDDYEFLLRPKQFKRIVKYLEKVDG